MHIPQRRVPAGFWTRDLFAVRVLTTEKCTTIKLFENIYSMCNINIISFSNYAALLLILHMLYLLCSKSVAESVKLSPHHPFFQRKLQANQNVSLKSCENIESTDWTDVPEAGATKVNTGRRCCVLDLCKTNEHLVHFMAWGLRMDYILTINEPLRSSFGTASWPPAPEGLVRLFWSALECYYRVLKPHGWKPTL